MTKTIGILLFDEFEELDAVGPWEVLSYWTRAHPDDDWRVLTFADSLGPVTAAKGLRVLTDTTVADLPALDVLVYPGGRGTRPHLDDDARLDWVRRQRETVPLMTSVCTGSLVYAAAGLLEGRRATTHWGSIVLLGSLDPTIDVRPDDRFVDDGDVITSAGVSAGIDMRSGARRIAHPVRPATAGPSRPAPPRPRRVPSGQEARGASGSEGPALGGDSERRMATTSSIGTRASSLASSRARTRSITACGTGEAPGATRVPAAVRVTTSPSLSSAR
jgi:putative intracellular protease/amidase